MTALADRRPMAPGRREKERYSEMSFGQVAGFVHITESHSYCCRRAERSCTCGFGFAARARTTLPVLH